MAFWSGREKRDKLMSIDEIKLVAELIQDPCPTMICSCCLGHRLVTSMMGGSKRCGQCNGLGFDIIGHKTKEACQIPDEAMPHWYKSKVTEK